MAIRGILIALIILMSALLVMVFRIMGGSAPVENNPPAEIVLEDSVLDVRTEVFEEATLERIIELAGQTAANRRETIVAQSGGTLSDISVDKGDVVAVGDVIALISADARDENLRQAEQALVAAEIDLDATRALVEEGFVARNTLSDLETAYEAALAAVEQARDQVNDLEVRSTIAGLVENRVAQVGGFVGAGDPVLAVTSMDPLLISARAGEQQIAEFAIGQIADVELATGQQVEAVISYISPFADAATRTFEIEAKAPNAEYSLFEGVTATVQVRIPTPGLHYVPTGLLQRAPDGRQGLYSVNADNQVVFNPTEVISADLAGSWVSGLEGDVTLITVGQASVKDGLTVNPVTAEEVEQISAEERLNQ